MKVYVVGNTRGLYDGGNAIEIQGVFSTMEAAEAAAEAAIEEYQTRRKSMGWSRFNAELEIFEYELNPPAVRPWD